MEKSYTVMEVIEMTVEGLSNIQVPAALAEQIAVPISRAISNLRACTQAFKDRGDEDVRAVDGDRPEPASEG